MRAVFEQLTEPFTWTDVRALLDRQPALRIINAGDQQKPLEVG